MEEDELTQHHISEKFNKELSQLRSKLLNMGGLVEQQLRDALIALMTNDERLAAQVYHSDYQINALEVEIDEECTRILAIRQPTAIDLRLVMTVIRTTPDLERIGDQAERIARMAAKIQGEVQPKYFVAMNHLGDQVRQMLRGALDAFARVDVEAALQVIRDDDKVDSEYDSVSRQLITYMMEDTRAIPLVLSILWSARALERIADHACNICEYLIYLVKGKDMRHTSLEQMEQQAHLKRKI